MIVHDEAPHPAVQGIRNVLIGLVVPVEIEFLRGKSPRQGRVNLPGGDHIRPHALFFQHRVEALEAEGLSGKQGQGARRHPFRHRLAVGPQLARDLVLIQHIQRAPNSSARATVSRPPTVRCPWSLTPRLSYSIVISFSLRSRSQQVLHVIQPRRLPLEKIRRGQGPLREKRPVMGLVF